MEEKERYEIHIYDDCNVDLYNNGVLDESITDTWKLEKLLNQQDKKIKDLEAKLAEERNKVVQKIRKKFPMPKDEIPDETTYSLNEFLDQIEKSIGGI